jgi:Family of unknown function (DUF6152)
MLSRLIVAIFIAGSLCDISAVPAHHSVSAQFDLQQRMTLTGTVTKVEWTNPHVWFYVDVKDEATGRIINWGAEMGSTNGLTRRGWTRNTLQVGMVVTFSASRARDGSYRVNALNVTLNGKTLGTSNP